jgi:endonuclease-8
VAALRPGDAPGLPQVRLRLAVPELAWDLIAPSTCELLDAAGRAKLVGRLGPDPLRSSSMSVEEFAELWARLQAMMRQAVDDGRIITVEAEDRLAVPEAESRRVYKQELCYDCGTPIVTWTINGRARYACPRCQPEWAG